MSAKESGGFKLIVVLALGALIAGAIVIKRQVSTPEPTTPTTTASNGAITSATPVTSASPVTSPVQAKPTNADKVALLDAAAKGDLPKVQEMHAKGVSLTGTLGSAVKSGNVALVTWLIDNGVDIHEDEDLASSPLILAEEHDAIAAMLIARGTKEPTLLQAVRAHAPKTVARLINTKKADPNSKNDDGEPALHLAVISGEGASRTTIVKTLLDAGAKPDVDHVSETPLAATIHQVEMNSDGSMDVLKLLTAKANVNPDAMMVALNMHSERKAAVLDLLLAAKMPAESVYRAVGITKDPKIIARLAAKGINWTTKDPYVEDPPLVSAARGIEVEVVKALLAAGAPVDGDDSSGDTPLLAAITVAPPDSEDAAKIVNMLLAKGANANRRAKDGRRPLHTAASRGDEAIVKALLGRGAHVDDQFNGESPLQAAETNGHAEVAKILISKGAKKTPPP